jgi:hypothetical protein
LIAALAVVSLLIAGLVAWLVTRPPALPPEGVKVMPVVDARPVTPVVAVVPPPPPAVVVPAVVTPDEAQLQLVSDPPGAKVSIDGVDVGATPVTVAIHAASVRTAVFSQAGFEPKKISISSADGPSLTVQLKKKTPVKKPGVPALEIRTDR